MAFAAIAAATGIASVAQANKAAKAQQRVAELQQRQQEVQAAASRRSAIRSAMVSKARAVATAQGLGAAGSSGVAGGISSLSSQLGANLGYQTEMSGLSRGITQYNSAANRAASMSRMFGSVSQGFGGFGGVIDYFGGSNTPAVQDYSQSSGTGD